EVALFVIWIVHIMTAVRAVVAGANAISREHVGQTWDALGLTGVSARKILFGKWRAALYSIRSWVLGLGVVRLAMLPVFMIALVHRYIWFQFGLYYTGGTGSSTYASTYFPDAQFTWVPEAALLAVVMVVLLTVLEALTCTALGLAASALA